jgi:hypothetical protein
VIATVIPGSQRFANNHSPSALSAKASPPRAPEIAREAVALTAQTAIVLCKPEDLSVDREPVQELVASTVLAQHEAAAGTDRNVIRPAQDVLAWRWNNSESVSALGS